MTLAALQSVKTTLSKESDALLNLTSHYAENIDTQLDLINSLGILYETNANGGKIVCCGIGKSYKVATKTVATLKSLTISADELHPAEALHGDLGLLRENDCIIFFTASGNTPELIQLLPHISPSIPIVLLTCSKESKLALQPQVKSLLYAELPDHLKESTIHGIPAPTVSATLSLALADAVALALAEMIEEDHIKRKKVFSMKHPGGSIGLDLSHLNDNYTRMDSSASQSSVPLRSLSSYTSMLSLDQLRFHALSTTTSSLGSDSGEVMDKTDSLLSRKIHLAGPERYQKFDKSVLMAWSELDLLKYSALFDFLLYESEMNVYASESSKVRSVYKQVVELPAGFQSMDDVLPAFTCIENC